ncbi:hypothetical protein ACE38V_11900 [Cytobacillus sp. Hz8]|uniref:hypothetical protein n=1 Tax=Cytobacillus sp. Hz8 TaxID=3347168 RepID=UPI0035DD0672
MALELQDHEVKLLSHYRLSLSTRDASESIKIADLLNESFLTQYLQEIQVKIGAPNIRVAASIFFKRYAYLSVLYLLPITAWNKKLKLDFDKIFIQTNTNDKHWFPTFYFQKLEVEEALTNRIGWREVAIKELFAAHIAPLINLTMKIAKVPQNVLLENIAVYLFWLYEVVLNQIEAEERVKEDFKYVMEEAPGPLFGNFIDNPFQPFQQTKVYIGELDEWVRPRKTCCNSYLINQNSRRCKVCPPYCKNNCPI